MPADYRLLAGIYDALGMGDFGRMMGQRAVDFALRNGWLGRQITEVGCGTGAALLWVARHHYITTGIDSSPEMLALAQQVFAGENLGGTWLEQDIRELNRPATADLVLAIDVLPELESTRDYEAVFKSVHTMLKPEKWFICDMYTIEGLVALNTPDRLEVNTADLTIFTHNQYDFERQMLTRSYLTFRRAAAGWQRQEIPRVLRGYPVQAVTALLQRSGFQVLYVLNPDMTRYETGKTGTTRVIIMAQKR